MIEHHTKNKGDLGVLKAKCDLYTKGWIPCQPETEHAPFDLVVWKDGLIKTVSVKYRELKIDSKTGLLKNSVEIQMKSFWADKNGTHTKDINKDFVDVLCVYNPDKDVCIYLDIKTIKTINKCININFGNYHPRKNMYYDYLDFP